MSLTVSAAELNRRIEEAGEVVTDRFGNPPGRPALPRGHVGRSHVHSRSRWEKRHDCLGCLDVARDYWVEAKRRQR